MESVCRCQFEYNIMGTKENAVYNHFHLVPYNAFKRLQSLESLTLSQTSHGFHVSAAEVCLKHSGKKRN